MPEPRTADLLLVGGTVHTLDRERPQASAIAISAGRVVGIGTDADVASLRGPRTEVIELHGDVVTPGLVDAHTHPVLGLDALAGTDLSACTDLPSLRAAVARVALSRSADDWVLGWGVDPNVFGSAPLGWQPLADVAPGRAAYLTLFDGHAALASPEALRRASVDGPRTFGGARSSVVCDVDGTPTGLLLEEAAMDLVAGVVPAESFELRLGRLASLLDEMAATGLTGGHVMDLDGDALDLYSALEADDRLPLRLRLAPWCRPEDPASRVDELVALQQRHGRLWQVAGVKLFIDGTIDGGTAWLHEPDCHGESTRPYWLDPHDYASAVRSLAGAGVQTATHAIGDAAVGFVLDTLASCPGRHRIEHIETLPEEQVPRFAELGVLASMQPTHATDYTVADGSDNWSRRLGPQRAARGWPCRDLVDSGAVLALGSDWPVAPFDPRTVLAAAQSRRPARRPDAAPVHPEQALTATQALRGMTSASAWIAGAERSTGRIAPGAVADLTVFGADPLRLPAADLVHVPITYTVVDGTVRHRLD